MKDNAYKKTTYSFKRITSILLINILVLLTLIILIEFIFSFFTERPTEHIVPSWRLNHTWRPNFSKTHLEWVRKNPEFPEPYVHLYNRQGWIESYDINSEKSEGIYRIFFVGDSFIEGTAPMNQSIPSIVEKELNKEISDVNVRS